MTTQLIKALRERANLFRAQIQIGTNIFDQAANTIDRLNKENKRLQDELTFLGNILKMFGEIELAEIPDDAVDVDALQKETPSKSSSTF